MVFFANSNDIIVVDIEVTEKIDDRYLKSFVLSNLKLKNISLENCDKLYVNYLEYPKEYQVFVVTSQFIFFDFEAFYSYYENRDFEGFELLIYSNFFLIFKDKKFFYYQKITLLLPDIGYFESFACSILLQPVCNSQPITHIIPLENIQTSIQSNFPAVISDDMSCMNGFSIHKLI